MSDPYSILGVSSTASDGEIRDAYKLLARKYSNDSAKMEMINRAYDEIVMQRGGLNSSPNPSHASHGYYRQDSSRNPNQNSGYSDLYDIREKIRSGRIEDALLLLDGMPDYARTAEWYYLKGVAQQRRGWIDYAAENFARACSMDPSNREYAAAKARLDNSRSGGYREEREDNSGCCCIPCGSCDGCSMCSSLICADSCCECMGGDLIPGC